MALNTQTRKLTIVAQDPSVTHAGSILTARVDVPAENLAKGPRGARVHVVDYDASTGTFYKPFHLPDGDEDPFARPNKNTILNDPRFHAQNVYAVVMRTLARFEFALGRRVAWGTRSHQLKVAPHAFADANAFYSARDEALMFGYFSKGDGKGTAYTCLSHDVVAHETTHALLDGLRNRYTDPSSPDQAAFHEGLSDVVALLSVFSVPQVVRVLIDRSLRSPSQEGDSKLVDEKYLKAEALRDSVLLGLAEEMGQVVSRKHALRMSAKLKPSPDYIKDPQYLEPHRRGEIFVAAVLNAFIHVLARRFAKDRAGRVRTKFLNRDRVVEEMSDVADYLLTMMIRALDYAPPVHIDFSDYLAAVLTADHEIRPDDSRYEFRQTLLDSFQAYGIRAPQGTVKGAWEPFNYERWPLSYERVHFVPLMQDEGEMFRFCWENRKSLGLYEPAYTEILSLRPSQRIAPQDGFNLRETVAEVLQIISLKAGELKGLKVEKPEAMPDDLELRLYGGSTLLFDEFGKLKFSIGTGVANREAQSKHLEYLWRYGYFDRGSSAMRRFSYFHLSKSVDRVRFVDEEW